MNIVLTASDEPLYQQIYAQLRDQIIRGDLASGYCLPPIRTVARELRISVITIKKAWEELERDGYILTRVGRGCFVAPLQVSELDHRRDNLAREKLGKDIACCKAVGLTKEEVLNLVGRLYDEEGP
jgi:GntR family transcriptional regulator